MCGIAGHIGEEPSSNFLPIAMRDLLHRGHDASSISIVNEGKVKKIYLDIQGGETGEGLMEGNIGLGHNRYTTTGNYKSGKARQPFLFRDGNAFCIFAHNGNITNTEELREEYIKRGCVIESDSDSEVLGQVFFQAFLSATGDENERVFAAVEEVHNKCKGAYSVITYLHPIGLIGFRDQYGIRPLTILRKDGETKGRTEYMLASEDVAGNSMGFHIESDVSPGEAVIIRKNQLDRKSCAKETRYMPCAFEYVYLANKESTMNGIKVGEMRKAFGRALGRYIQNIGGISVDYVMPIPESPRDAARETAKVLGIEHREGIKRNKNIRSFILPENRLTAVRSKFDIDEDAFNGNDVLLIDDSIVRGNTIRGIVERLRKMNVGKVCVASYAPKVLHPNRYGIAIRTRSELVAHQYPTNEDLAEHLGVDKIFYLPLELFEQTLVENGNGIQEFELSCFTGKYLEDLPTKSTK